MPSIAFDRYYKYEELTALLKAYTVEYPQFVSLASIGKSHEGRDIWVATVTNTATGPHDEKPALWVDGNIHASEVSGGSACLYYLNQLVTQYGVDADTTTLLDTRTVYICPRLAPDGVEWALESPPRIRRSSTRPYPFDEVPSPGFEEADIDGDGRILNMRIEDPNGGWKAHPDEPRLLVKRGANEYGGKYYRVICEGHVNGAYDGVTLTDQPLKENLDINRNYPADWRPEALQLGAGPYPTSEPEIRAHVQFFITHPNITAATQFHTFSGVLLRSYSNHADDNMPTPDLKIFKETGRIGTEMTGYPNISIFHEFKYDPKMVITGGSIDWMYGHLGIFAWAVEIWSPQRQAGIEAYKYIEWYGEHPFEDDLKMLKWSDDVLQGKGHVDWYPFDHPVLGKVELGGWDHEATFRNPPPHLLEKEIAIFPKWLSYQALISPKLERHSVDVEKIGESTYCIRVGLKNTGYLPTYVSKIALDKKVVRGIVCEIELPDGAELRAGLSRQDIGQLAGYSHFAGAHSKWRQPQATGDRAKTEYIVYAPDGGNVKITAKHERAGVVRINIPLG